MSPECLNEKISGLLLHFKGIYDPKSLFSLSLQKLDKKILVTCNLYLLVYLLGVKISRNKAVL